MNIYVAQIYIEAGINYPFSHIFQNWISEQLTSRVHPSQAFIQTYSEDFNLIFNMIAKSKLVEPEIRGPTVFKRTKDVEYTIFLPHDGRQPQELNELRRGLKWLFESIVKVLEDLGMDAAQVAKDSPILIEQVISEPAMIKHRKPIAPPGELGAKNS